MTSAPRHENDQTRERILDTAEALFLRIGYTKTTIADIAQALGMSGANIYRFFTNKSDINNGLCQRRLAEIDAIVDSYARASGPASQRLEEMIVAVHKHSKTHFTDETTVHEMITVAMQEHWQAVDAHIDYVRQIFAQIIQQGIDAGELAPCAVADFAKTACTACCGIFHPTMIAECQTDTTPEDVRRLARLIIRGLRQPDPAISAP